MSQNYQRYFIVLTEESPEYTITGKKALGRCIMESKAGVGKISFSVQNIKPGVISGAYIVSSDGFTSTAVEIGRIISDSRGRAEIRLDCDVDNVLNSGIALKDFNVAGMMAHKNEGIHALLLGFKDGAVMWKNNFRIHNDKRSQPTPKAFPTLEEAEAEQAEATVDAAASDNLFEESPIGNVFAEEHPVDDEATEPVPGDFFETLEEGPAEKVFKDMAKKINVKLAEVDNMALEGLYSPETEKKLIHLHKKAKGDIDMIFRSCSKIRPFKNQEEKLEWVRISPSELSYLPDEFNSLNRDYFIGIAYRKFGHLVLGCEKHDSHISLIFGAPDIYLGTNEQSAKLSGMTSFKCCDCGELLEGKHGYWLKSVDYTVDE